jgi:hypothetical protein
MKCIILKAFLFLLIPITGCFTTHAQTRQVFVTDSVFKHPESAVYDAKRQCVYISNMDKTTPVDSLHTDFISKILPDGDIDELHWLKGLSSPTGLVMYNQLMYAVERNGVAVIDPEIPKILYRIPIETKGFLNDITVAANGTFYVSEMEKEGRIFAIQNGKVSVFIEDTLLAFTNGLLVDGNTLMAGVNSDYYLKKIDIPTKTIENFAYLGPGNIDGIQQHGDRFLVSLFMGNLFKIAPSGAKIEVMNTRDQELFICDFAYLLEEKLLIIPSLRTNRVYGFQLEK